MGYILDGINAAALQLMMADRPHWVPGRQPNVMDTIREIEAREQQRNSRNSTDNTTKKGVSPLDFFTNYAIKD